MKLLFWILLGFATVAVTTWVIMTPGKPQNPSLILVLMIVYAAAPVGTFWMLYAVVRRENRPLPMVLLAFVPFAFLWYYFEHVRGQMPREHLTQRGRAREHLTTSSEKSSRTKRLLAILVGCVVMAIAFWFV